MHINHLIWDHIFTDPEFGDMARFVYDSDGPYTDTYESLRLISKRVNRLYRRMYTKDLPYTDRCRGIYVIIPDEPMIQQVKPIPSLKILSLLAIHKIYAHEYRDASLEYTRAFRKFGITKRHIKKKE